MTALAIGSPEWYDERRTYIGASEAAAALGLSPYDDPIEVWASKVDPGYVPKESTFRMQLGNLIEPVIGTLYEQHTGRKLRAGHGRLRRHRIHPYAAAHPDFYVRGERRLVQAKMSDMFEGGIPFHYQVQGVVELACTKYDVIDFAVLTPFGFTIYEQPRDPDFERDVLSDLAEWWENYVSTRIAPPPNSQSGASLRRMHPEAKLKVGKVASAEQERLIEELIATKESRKMLVEQEAELTNRVKALVGDAAWIEGAGRRLTWSRFDVTKVGWEEIAAGLTEAVRPLPSVTVGRGTMTGEQLIEWLTPMYTRTERQDRLSISNLK